ncbi:hypothetical protein MPSEU_000236000 [Mayamaea pseudoterrestris]|nr:hypothetical protein MPSEU_000236000 [Mayamaea pseudoterrestris]
MFDLTTFLVRWFFLSSLARNTVEIQTMPTNQHFFYQQHEPPDDFCLPKQERELIWRDQCLGGILNYPPGTGRLLMIDAMRNELVERLSHLLTESDQTLSQIRQADTQRSVAAKSDVIEKDDPYSDADSEILRHFGEGTSGDERAVDAQDSERRTAKLIVSRGGTIVENDYSESSGSETVSETMVVETDTITATIPPPPPPVHLQTKVQQAVCCSRDIRDYLPQLVSAVLKSPSLTVPYNSQFDPIQRLRKLIINRCKLDPSWGVELCWLLEAEVGRTWKKLFEHRQQTGKRLIIVMPSDKAVVLAKIGMERREAFDLLQDAEQATAFGYLYVDLSEEMGEQHRIEDCGSLIPRLPQSLSVRRCRYFGDTMFFIDWLTKGSLKLRELPQDRRYMALHEILHEINRRLRRRMVSSAETSLDVEDNLSAYDGPRVEDLKPDMYQNSVYFPLIPQTGTWPDGTEQFNGEFRKNKGTRSVKAVRCLNIVVSEARLLASRDRCPFLIQLEVADTNLESGDARLYASDPVGLGSTMVEALGMAPAASSPTQQQQHNYQIPFELLHRGGWQHRGIPVPIDHGNSDGIYADQYEEYPYDFRQHEYEQLHQQLQWQPPPRQHGLFQRSTVSMGANLLDRVFGQAWAEKCREIRESSPYGNVAGWRLASFIIKAGEDIRREALVMQIITKLVSWFQEEIPAEHRPYMRPYTIMCVGGDAGLLECLSDTKSVDEVKKKVDGYTNLRDYFERAYGPPTREQRGFGPPSTPRADDSITFEKAQDNFLRSLVGYSLVSYILQIKDRHNANILLDREGHIIHIDFGFVLGDTPKMGMVPLFREKAPFKLSQEFWDVLGGWHMTSGGLGVRFCKMFELAFECASAHSDEIATLVEATVLSLNSNPQNANEVANGVRKRLTMRGPPRSRVQEQFIMSLVSTALNCWSTSTYDWAQKTMNGYL